MMLPKSADSQDQALAYAESIINTVRDPLLALDQDLKVVTASRAFYDVFKVNPEQTIGQFIYDLGNKQWNIPKLRDLLETILPQKASFDNYEIEHVFSTIGKRTMLLNARQIDEVLGRKRIILLAIEDITDRKELEALKEQALAYAESIINTVRDPLLALDQDLKVVTASQAFYDVFKVNPQETIGQFIYDLGNKQWDIPKLRDLLETILPQKTTFNDYELEHVFSTIGKRTMLLNARQIDEVLGKKRIILLAIEDITARKEAEEVIAKLDADLKLHAIELEAANKELEAFSYSVSHDLRAPVRHIAGFVGLLKKSSASQLDEKGLRQLSVISDSAQQMGRLIDDLLVFSRMARVVMQKSTVNANEVVKDVVSELGSDTKGRDIEWKIDKLPSMEGDPPMLKQVFANLIQNAVKYTGGRSHARIEVGAADGQKGETDYFVRDNGAGFDMQYAGKLFGVFQRLHKAEEFEGTGIGLANVRRIITRHGGRTWAEGVLGEGATFYFSLPKLKEK